MGGNDFLFSPMIVPVLPLDAGEKAPLPATPVSRTPYGPLLSVPLPTAIMARLLY